MYVLSRDSLHLMYFQKNIAIEYTVETRLPGQLWV